MTDRKLRVGMEVRFPFRDCTGEVTIECGKIITRHKLRRIGKTPTKSGAEEACIFDTIVQTYSGYRVKVDSRTFLWVALADQNTGDTK